MVNIYSPLISPRLQYVLRVIFRDHLRVPFLLSADRAEWEGAPGPKIHYTDEVRSDSLGIPPSGFLAGLPVDPMRGAVPLDDSRVDLSSPGGAWPFDLFVAIFWLLARVEEYGDVYDQMGRFSPEGSWAARNGWLDRPLVDEWIQLLGKAPAGFRFSPTYDIDQPWCYLHKNPLKALLRGGALTLAGRRADPFDNFHWLDWVHESLEEKMEAPVYFFPLAARQTRFDKNPSPGNGAYQQLIEEHSRRYPVGIHPSYYTADKPELLGEETALLSRITGLPVTVSRYHYIRFRLPEGYRRLLEAGIRADYSMGYGERNGFRASYSRPFPWYDLEKETETALQVVPFCWMDATAHRDGLAGGDATAQGGALSDLAGYVQRLRACGGRLTTIWHNSSLGEVPRWIGWRNVYLDFLNGL